MTPEQVIEQADRLALFAFECGIPITTWQLRRLPGLVRWAEERKTTRPESP